MINSKNLRQSLTMSVASLLTLSTSIIHNSDFENVNKVMMNNEDTLKDISITNNKTNKIPTFNMDFANAKINF